jgi:uncharacterized protein YwgA
MNDILERNRQLRAILDAAGGSVLGKKKFQKLVYLAQEHGFYLGYDFDYHFHGVFCSELEGDLRIAESFGVVEQEVQEDEYGNPVLISATEVVLEPEDDEEVDEDTKHGLGLVAALKDEPARVLEVLSTIVYLSNKGYTGKDLQSELKRLKGHLSAYFQQANDLYAKHY